MRSRLLVGALLLALMGCTRGDASQGRSAALRIVSAEPANWGPAWGPAYVVQYETALEVWNIPPLRQEAESLWATLRPSIEARGVCAVQLRASEPEREAPIPGTKQVLTARRNWDFLLFRDATGQWKWLTSTSPPPQPCTPKAPGAA